ncbi:ChaN family lipoprotein [Thiolapillus sp.]
MANKNLFTYLLLAFVSVFLSACGAVEVNKYAGKHHVHGKAPESAETTEPPSAGNTRVVRISGSASIEEIIPALAKKRVVFVGETHDNYAHHLSQLEIIKGLHEVYPDLAIGMEMFQKPFQAHLDSFIAGEISEQQFLKRSEWFDRWSFDYRLYRPILDYARQHKIPVVALNASKELKNRVSEVGIAGLNEEERAQVPAEVDRSDEEYTARLRKIFHQHPGSNKRNFERFLDVQLLWDESMAERAAAYLKEHPSRKLVVLAGSGHLMHGSGIPKRVSRRMDVETAIVLPADNLKLQPGIADFLVFPEAAKLPKAGLMGVFLGTAEEGVLIASIAPESAAEKAGLKRGDVIQQLNGKAVKTPSDIKLVLFEKKPGENVQLQVLRKRLLLSDQELDFSFPLGG